MESNETTITYDLSQLLGQFYRLMYSRNFKDKTEDFDERLTKRLGLINHNHFIIESCIYLLEDTEYAICDFERFGLDGPTKFNNLGERYLRLYGILNAVNSQKSIVITLNEIFNIPQKKKLIKKFKTVKIIDTRHMIASHSVDYIGGDGRDFFRVTMTTVRGKGENIQVVSKDKSLKVDLVKELNEFRTVLHLELLKVVNHLLKRFIDSKSNRYPELKSEVEFVEARIEGHLVMKARNGKIIIRSK